MVSAERLRRLLDGVVQPPLSTGSWTITSAGRHPLLYGAKADGAALETIIRETFAAGAARAGGALVFRELVPTVPGDAPGASSLYLVLACVVPAHVMVVTMQRAVGFGRRAHVATIIGWGAAAAAASYLAAAYAVHAIPQHPLDLLYLFLLTQAVSLTSYGLVPFFGGVFPGIAVTLFVLLGVPSSGAAVSVELVPGFFGFLHPILPMGNGVDALRSVGYFGNSQLLRPTRCSAPGSPPAPRSSCSATSRSNGTCRRGRNSSRQVRFPSPPQKIPR